MFDVESAAAHAQGRNSGRSTRRPGLPHAFGFHGANPRWTVGVALDGRAARACPCAAQLSGERRTGTGPRGRSGVRRSGIGRRRFARGYPLGDRRRVERIASTAPAHGAKSAGARGPRQIPRYLIFCACASRPTLAMRNLVHTELRALGPALVELHAFASAAIVVLALARLPYNLSSRRRG